MVVRKISSLIATLGIFLQIILIIYLVTELTAEKRDIFVGTLTIATLLSLLIAHQLKRYFKKYRPREMYFEPEDKYRFPSEHASIMTTMTVIIFSYNPTLGTFSIGITTLVLLARKVSGVHVYKDIFAGILLGGLIAYIVFLLL